MKRTLKCSEVCSIARNVFKHSVNIALSCDMERDFSHHDYVFILSHPGEITSVLVIRLNYGIPACFFLDSSKDFNESKDLYFECISDLASGTFLPF